MTMKTCGGVLLGTLMLFSWDTQAQQENGADKTLSPYFFVENGDPAVDRLPLSKTEVNVVISGVIAGVKVTQTWTNQGKRPINTRYIFPASTRAAVHGLTMTIGDKLIRAKIERREKARAKYEAAKQEGKSAALLEQQRPNVFSMDLANVMPGDVINVELQYTELLVPTEGVYEFVYPTVVGPRYSSQKEAGAKKENSSRSMVLISDGYVSADQSVFSFINKNLNQANMFSFGIGSSINRHLMEGVAKAGKGELFVVTRPEDGPEVARRFKEYVESPVLTGVKLSCEGFRAYGIEPESIPDLFASRPLVIFGKYQGEAEGRLKIEGVSGNGSFARIFDVSETKALEANRALRYLWARTRIANLSDFHLRDEEVVEEITSLGLTYNLLTPYTSFIAVYERIRNKAGNAKNVTQPLPLPAGVSELAVGNNSVTSGDEPSLLALFLILLIVSGAITRRRYRRFSAGALS